MNEEALNTSVRKFLKKVGITAQREIEKAVRQALSNGRLKGNESFATMAVVTIKDIDFKLDIDGRIELE